MKHDDNWKHKSIAALREVAREMELSPNYAYSPNALRTALEEEIFDDIPFDGEE
ncbi:MAG TPA: hypothetical protein VMY37_40045 [Thermoguttaceae bacterium]|nr:hypothetical protein [Thermoguttaceae bacterium]